MWRDWNEWYGMDGDKMLEWDVTCRSNCERTVMEWIVMETGYYGKSWKEIIKMETD
jgi:hypothetical protein